MCYEVRMVAVWHEDLRLDKSDDESTTNASFCRVHPPGNPRACRSDDKAHLRAEPAKEKVFCFIY
ncbi:MAG: hypothetical protein KatS3mg049_1944 [Caldilinea sp.]|jgi:hypothetical protein|uniref:Uncharacterized protein n=1 Tax=Caldilinea aerophila (strain DSM 14535 / JCM 11387 / NBRC 104270 / STL-6-O1) TaxID=926550 RepID=I0I3V5_CALAS|nr:hypothetical protein CLDAP_19030 [Caldilinea aerophila DSM 14535 = NBRC 104270]GIV73388.1 MAG: hypothetical protein KatS3mg049_1944 [Caldilinea sp.]